MIKYYKLTIFSAILFLITPSVHASNHSTSVSSVSSTTYRVTEETQTLFGIGLLLYGKIQMGYEIAKWNHIPPPYKIYFYQNLQLKLAPTLTHEEGLQKLLKMRKMWSIRKIPRIRRISRIRSIRRIRKIRKETSHFNHRSPSAFKPKLKPIYYSKTYQVTDEARTLCNIALLLYGNFQMGYKIAQWNHISPPYKIYLHQNLQLKLAPTLTPQEGAQKLLAMWRKRMHIDVLNRNPSGVNSEPKVATPSKQLNPQELSQEYFSQGVKLFEKNQLLDALEYFEKSQHLNVSFLPNWFYRLKIQAALNMKEKGRETLKSFLKYYPEFQGSPVVNYYEGILN